MFVDTSRVLFEVLMDHDGVPSLERTHRAGPTAVAREGLGDDTWSGRSTMSELPDESLNLGRSHRYNLLINQSKLTLLPPWRSAGVCV